jgi:hypothetical protein
MHRNHYKNIKILKNQKNHKSNEFMLNLYIVFKIREISIYTIIKYYFFINDFVRRFATTLTFASYF